MTSRSLRVSIAGLVVLTVGGCTSPYGTIDRRAPALDRIVPDGARIERIAKGFAFTEGPQWMPGGYLMFGDLPSNVIWRWDTTGVVSLARKRSGYAPADHPPGLAMGSNGMALDAAGRLTVCEPGNRRVTRTESDGSLTVLADNFQGRRLNSPNDLAFRRSDGSLYFTDPPTGLPKEDTDSAKELPFNGVFRLAGNTLQLLDSTMTRPNGIGFSPDGRFLYVSNADPHDKIWRRFEVRADGSLDHGTTFLDLNDQQGQAPDGLEVDQEGTLYLTGPGGLWIVAPTGKILGVIRTREEPSNVAWGGTDGRMLYLTAPHEVYRIHLAIPGTVATVPSPSAVARR